MASLGKRKSKSGTSVMWRRPPDVVGANMLFCAEAAAWLKFLGRTGTSTNLIATTFRNHSKGLPTGYTRLTFTIRNSATFATAKKIDDGNETTDGTPIARRWIM